MVMMMMMVVAAYLVVIYRVLGMTVVDRHEADREGSGCLGRRAGKRMTVPSF